MVRPIGLGAGIMGRNRTQFGDKGYQFHPASPVRLDAVCGKQNAYQFISLPSRERSMQR